MPKLTFSERATFTLVTCLSIKWKYGDHLSELPYETNVQCPLENFRMLLLKLYSYLTKV